MRVGRERRPGTDVQDVPRHSEVDQESPTSFEPDNHILAASIDGCDALALQLDRYLESVEWTSESWISDLDVLERAAHEQGREPATDGLHFRKLRHRTRVVGGVRVDAPG